jgi:hypothetical protein
VMLTGFGQPAFNDEQARRCRAGDRDRGRRRALCVILAVGTGESVPKRPRPARLAALRGLRSTHDAAREQA